MWFTLSVPSEAAPAAKEAEMPSTQPDFFYAMDGSNALLYPNPGSVAARDFYNREVFQNNAEVKDGAIWVEDRNWEDVRDNWLPSEGLTLAPR